MADPDVTAGRIQSPPAGPGEPWHRLTAEAAYAHCASGPKGLTAPEAARRLAQAGPNTLRSAPAVRPWRILADQFKSLIIWVLLGAGTVSASTGDTIEAVAIFAILVLNAAIGFWQEYSAGHAIAALRQLTAPAARVRRDDRVVTVPAADVVGGDLLELEAGELVAADARIVGAASLACIESALTGEAETVAKQIAALPAGDVPLGDRTNLVFMGTAVATGSGRAVVVATAMETELGRIAGLLGEAEADPGTPLQRKLESFGRSLVWIALGLVALMFGIGLWRGTPPLELFKTAIGLIVAAVPEGLPAVVTVALSLGVMRMARRRALVRRLAAVETLGSASVICTDKTGTLTAGEMTVRALWVDGTAYEVTGEGYGPTGEIRRDGRPVERTAAGPLPALARVLLGGNRARLAEEAGRWTVAGDPTEGALLAAGAKAGGDRVRLEREQPLAHELPFDSDRKLSTLIRRQPDGSLRAYCNGAPDVLLKRCTGWSAAAGVRPMTEADRGAVGAENSRLAGRALRVLGSGWRDLPATGIDLADAEAVERELVFAGLSGMQDPLRPEAKAAVAQCRSAGIRVVMITGDHPQTAAAIAADLGLEQGPAVVTGAELEAMDPAELQRRAADTAVYARVTAADKLRIVRALQAGGDVVAMTGDGVNDAPAIKAADIGIAMGRGGTEVTKQAADMIVTDDNFATIVAAVEEGRGIYDNIRKTLQYLLAGNTAELLLMAACLAVGLPLPLLPIQLLWINLVTDGLPALCLATDPIDAEVMARRPRNRREEIADPRFLRSLFLTGLVTAAVALAVFLHGLRTGDVEAARTAAFTVLVFGELLRAFGARSATAPLWRIPFFSNPRLVAVVALTVGLQFWSLHGGPLGRLLGTEPLPLADGLVLLALGAIPLLVLEAVKAWRRRQPAASTPDRL